MEIGEVIKELRLMQGMTQKELGERCGTSVNTVSSWENGKAYPPKGSLDRICHALGANITYLLAKACEDNVSEEQRAIHRALLELLRNDMMAREPEMENDEKEEQ